MDGRTRLRSWFLLALAALASGCANVETPPGSPPDVAPPTVVERYPAPDAVVPDLDGDAWLRFDEPIQSPRGLDRQLDYSPAWEWRFTPTTSGFKVRPRDGWRSGVVYRVRLAAGVTDLMRNRTTQPIEWTFSTGPEIPRTRVEGTVFDRVTVRGAQDARLLFLPPDSTPYTVVSDTGGSYSMRTLPPGAYTVLGFVDQNQNRRLDPAFEPWDSAGVVLDGPAARVVLDLWMLPADSTAPVLLKAGAPDSATVLLEFDDPLDPEASLDSMRLSVTRSDDGSPVAVSGFRVGDPAPAAGEGGEVPPAAGRAEVVEPADTARAPVVVAPAPGDAEVAEGRARLDSLRAARRREAADSLARRADVDAEEPAEEEPAAEEQATPLRRTADLKEPASPRLTVSMGEPLREGSYRVSIAGVPNLRGLAGGGDTTFVYEPPPPPPPEAPGVPPDSLGPPADSLAVPADTMSGRAADEP